MSLGLGYYALRKSYATLQEKAKSTNNLLMVKRGSEFVSENSTDLIPGDIIEITDNMVVPADCALIEGNAILNEVSMTGEAVPVQKYELPNKSDIFDIYKDKKHILYEGTTVYRMITNDDSEENQGGVLKDDLLG